MPINHDPREHFARHAPPWWPADEPWPPQGPPNRRYWRGMRGRYMRNFGCFLALMVFIATGIFSTVFWLIANATGLVHFTREQFLAGRILAPIIIIAGMGIFFAAARAFRRSAQPMGDLIESAGRVADGDYSVHVPEYGPPEARGLARAFNTMVERLRANDEQRRALLADVTHELRTPITVIQGSLEGMLDGVYPADPAHIEAVLEETRVLSRIIDDLRLLSLAESGALKLQTEATDLPDLLEDAASAFRPQADAAGVTLSVDAPPDLPALELDPTRIREVIDNLLSNALRYTPSGGQISLRARLDGARVQVDVSDSGAGISAEDLPRIFDRFYKTTESRGSGLGLAIAKNLVLAHHGEINAQSEVGKGTTITFWLPVGLLLN